MAVVEVTVVASKSVIPLVQLFVPQPSRLHVNAKPLLTTDTSDVNLNVILPLVAVRFSVPVPQLFQICDPVVGVPSHTVI